MNWKIWKKLKDSNGMTLIEVLVGLTIFAIGLLGLSRVSFQAMHANLRSKHTVIATNLAHQRMEEIISATRYDNITEPGYPDEDYGNVNGGMGEYAKFNRAVSVVDSLNAIGTSVMKEVSVRVEWNEMGTVRNVELRSSISRYKDISL